MRRRALLCGLGTAVSLTGAGCLGMGGEVVVSVQRSLRVPSGQGWVKRIPDVSDTGGAISYAVRSDDRPFDVYLFREEQYRHYDAFTDGEDPERTPPGDGQFSKAAVGDQVYEATTDDGGAREALTIEGPSFFVVDHSNYRMEHRVDEHADPLQVTVDLEVVQQRDLL